MKGRKFLKNIFLTLVSLLFFGNLCYSASLKMGYIEFPPVFSTNSHGKPEGILIDLAAKVIPEAGYEWEAFPYPVKRMSDYIAKGKLDLWIGLKTIPDFEGTTFKGDSEVLKITLKAYRTKNIPDIKKQGDLNGKSIIIIRGYSYGGWINYIKDVKNNIDFIETNNHKSAFRMLKAGRSDYVLDYQQPAEKSFKKFKL